MGFWKALTKVFPDTRHQRLFRRSSVFIEPKYASASASASSIISVTGCIGAFRPLCASEMTSFTPSRPRSFRLSRKASQNAFVFDSPIHVGRIQPQVGPFSLQRTLQERLHALINAAADRRHLAAGDTGHSHRLDYGVNLAG
ncbi:hypothetical protein ACZ87_02057 [Candidatus Erwinia dacicola]|uniref:Uncharacterized protein n=1 Tax=Candidatus Erwinia dacicola TaxID=252393 RepID=A0A328TKJ3_9GAMM|nr:hypothetical protein ACZ87_02057 [Candidatus Erwinia dacicola]